MAKNGKTSDSKGSLSEKDSGATKNFLAVGLGASAGGTSALTEFFGAMPAGSGMAFVVFLHSSQASRHDLAELLRHKTKMKVIRVARTVKIKPDSVYVIPAEKYFEIQDGMIKLSATGHTQGLQVTMDRFFRTMAEAYGRKAVCIILSGTDSDGMMGMKHIKDKGGFTMIRDPGEAEFDGMPASAIGTKIADVVLPVKDMPEKLMFIRETTAKWRLADEGDGRVAAEIKNINLLRDVLTLLRVRTGHDFSSYKRPTLLRRLARHLQVYETDDLEAYLKVLRANPEEVLSLLKNLLINVTGFFRDKEAFEVLEKKVIPALFKDKNEADQVRVWIAGCSTGEEAYSIAILLSEYAANLPHPPKIQLFASDVDEDAIHEAREGRFPEAAVSDISPARLQKFFIKEEDHTYRIHKSIREKILFAPHNILRDPPFSRLDLVSCRNVMIYLNRKTQEQILSIFHFALRENGFLFLGSSETAGGASRHFLPVDKKQRIYHCRPSGGNWKAPPSLPLSGAWNLQRHESSTEAGGNLQSFGELHHRLIEYYAPPSILINEEGDILHLSETAGKYLHFSGGEPSFNIAKVIHPDLLSDIRAASYTARKENKTVEAKNIRVQMNGGEKRVNITVRPVGAPGVAVLILFEENTEKLPSEQPMQAIIAGDKAMEAVVRRMEEELRHTRDRLRNTIEQNETSTEELKASNEELQAINEELRSTAEELETSKEELQSVNEELTTVNNELKNKVEEVSRANSDLENLMRSTNIATIFLDKELNIKRYTPSATGVFNLIPGDIGRPLSHITHRLSPDNFQKDAAEVLQSLQPLELEVQSDDGRAFVSRFSPYRTTDDKIDGVVISFIDITKRKKAEHRIREGRAYAEAIIATVREPLIVLDKELRVVFASRSFYKTFGVTREAFEGQYIYTLGNRRWEDPKLRKLQGMLGSVLSQESRFRDFEVEQYFDNLGLRTMLFSAREITHTDGKERMILLTIEDVTERKKAEDRQKFILKLSDALRTLKDAAAIQETAARLLGQQLKASRAFYFTVKQDKQNGGYVHIIAGDYYHPPDMASIAGRYPPLADKQNVYAGLPKGENLVVADVNKLSKHAQGAKARYHAFGIQAFIAVPLVKNKEYMASFAVNNNTPRQWTTGEVALVKETAERTWAAVQRAKAEEGLQWSEERLQLALNAAKMSIFVYYPEEKCIETDRQTRILLGLKQDECLQLDQVIKDLIHPDDRERVTLEIAKAVEPGGSGRIDTDFRITLKQQKTRYWVNLTARTQFQGDPPRAVILLGVTTDIMDRKQIEEALRESEANYRGMVNQAIAGISKIDKAGQIIFSNEQMAEMLGYKVDEFVQLNIMDVVHEKDKERTDKLFDRLKAGGAAYTVEKRMVCKNGRYIWVNNQVSPILDKDGQFVSALLVSIDITEQKTIEKQKNDFIGIASHELKTPLTGINAYTELLLEKLSGKGASDSVSLVKKLNKQVDRLNRLIRGLLDTTRISEGRFDLQYERFDLNKLIEERVSEARLTAPRHEIIVEPGKLLPLLADPERIGQVLTNLVSNAVKYSPDAEKVVVTSKDINGEKVKVRVRDFGIGVRPEMRHEIFKRFFRSLDSGNASGFGLGLYISNEIIKMHFGEMGVENLETGSVFYFIIPYKPEG